MSIACIGPIKQGRPLHSKPAFRAAMPSSPQRQNQPLAQQQGKAVSYNVALPMAISE